MMMIIEQLLEYCCSWCGVAVTEYIVDHRRQSTTLCVIHCTTYHTITLHVSVIY